ncbi:MAG: PilZ domain-containing protein [Sphingomicrobium sp.]
MTDAPTLTTFVVEDRLPWPDEAYGLPERGPFDAAVLCDAGGREDCAILRISTRGATVRSERERRPGQIVAIELETGKRTSGRIAWIQRGELGLAFDEPVDMLALLNRTLVSQPVERRTMPRVEIRCPAQVKCGAALLASALRDISASGLQLEGKNLPAVGSYITVLVEGLVVPAGEIAWRRGGRAGVELFEPMRWTSVIPWVRSMVRRTAH